MSERFFETPEKHYETPETNVKVAALNLARHKMLVQIAKGHTYPSLDIDDLNEVLMVAGLPVIVPQEVNTPELKIIQTSKDFDPEDPLDFGDKDVF